MAYRPWELKQNVLAESVKKVGLKQVCFNGAAPYMELLPDNSMVH